MNLAIYRRSDTQLDAVSNIGPVSFLGRGPVRTARARRTLARLGFLDTLFASDVGATQPVYETAPAGSGFNWNNLLTSVKDIYLAKEQADLQRDLYQINVQRAQQGLAPISASQVAPQVNVGVAPDTQRTVMIVGLGAAAILAGAYAFGVIGKGRHRRR